ncbi:MAG: DNA recombination protein RmuC [Clostridia bacterium]
MTDILLYILCVIAVALVVMMAIQLSRRGNDEELLRQVERIKREMEEQQRDMRLELADTLQRSIKTLGDMLANSQARGDALQSLKLAEIDNNLVQKQEQIQKTLSGATGQLEERLKTFATENEQKLENIRNTVEKKLAYMQEDNNKKLDEIRQIVDEKLQKTLEERMTQSFTLVNERLEQVYKGLGEMQTLAIGVGDLKKVLSNVKTRGMLGEIQLGAILSEILAPEQYDINVVITPNSKNPVEYAIKLPADDDNHIYMPIDSKFPMDAYSDLMDAYESAAPERVAAAKEVLKSRIRSSAKDIHDKYIAPPETTEFGIMFLPTEGLYAEAVKLGLIEQLQHDYRVSIAGPSTMAALLNSLQMGFRSVAIQKRSGEVWKVLSAVKTEFDKFQDVLERTQDRLTRANNELDSLIGVRTRQIRHRLKEVTTMPQTEIKLYLPDTEPFADDDVTKTNEED